VRRRSWRRSSPAYLGAVLFRSAPAFGRGANDKIDDLARFTGRDFREDVRDFQRNLDQLARGGATDQDINALIRSVQEARSAAHGNAEAAYDGTLEALANCE
jgi:hypothetical protein